MEPESPKDTTFSAKEKVEMVNPAGEYRIDFQPGLHPISDKMWESVDRNWEKDWYNTSVWNEEVADRFRNRGYGVVTIDALFPENDEKANSAYWWKEFIWKSLPLPPKEINTVDGKILVVGGDTTSWETAMAFWEQYGEEPGNQVGVIETKKSRSILYRSLLKSTVLSLGGAIMAAYPLFSMDSIPIQEQDKTAAPKHLTRRQFLKVVAAAGGYLTIKGLGSAMSRPVRWAAAHTSSNMGKDIFIVAHDWFEDESAFESIRDGRTALVIQKTLDSMYDQNLPAQTNAAVLMGSDHTQQAREFIQSEKKRHWAISEYVRGMESLAREVAQKFHLDPEPILLKLREKIPKIYLYEVDGDNLDPSALPEPQLQEAITLQKILNSPVIASIVQQSRDRNNF